MEVHLDITHCKTCQIPYELRVWTGHTGFASRFPTLEAANHMSHGLAQVFRALDHDVIWSGLIRGENA